MTEERRRDIVNAVMVILCLVLIHIISLFCEDKFNSFNSYLKSQAHIYSVYVNVIAIIRITYSKTTSKFEIISRNTFFFGMLGFMMAALIFAHAIALVYPNIPIYAKFMCSKIVFIVYNIAFFGIIFAISCTKGIKGYTKENL